MAETQLWGDSETDLIPGMKDAVILKTLKGLFGAITGYMIWVTIRTSLKRNLFKDLPRLSKEPWFTATIKDYYLNIVLISAWMLYKERSNWARAGWLTAFCTLGSMATGVYALKEAMGVEAGELPAAMLLRKE